MHIRHPDNTTDPKMQKMNERKSKMNYAMLVAANAKPGDYWITLTYKRGSKLPANYDEMKKQVDKYFRKLRQVYKQQGVELKYIRRLISKDDEVRPHVHFWCNNDGVNLKDFPPWEYGNPNIKIVDNRLHQTLGEYICQYKHRKKADDEDIEIPDDAYIDIPSIGRVSTSKNLVRPITKYYVIKKPSWRDDPNVPNGYMLDKESLVNGDVTNYYTGGVYRYQSYVLVKIRKKE